MTAQDNMIPLFETILDYIPAPEGDPEATDTGTDQYHRLQRIRRTYRNR